MSELLPNIRKIAVLRANALGDFIFTLPALAALRAAYPQAEIVLLGLEWHAAFLDGRPGPVDRVVVVPPYAGVRDDRPAQAAEQERFFAAMRREAFDLALQIHGGGRNSNPFVLKLGARTTAGLRTPDAPLLDRWVPYLYYQSEVMRYLEVAGLVGARAARLEPRLAVTERDAAEAAAALPDQGQRLVALHPGASDPRRHWPAEKFAAVGDALAEAGATVAVTGTPAERPLVEAVVGAMRAPAHNLCGALSSGGLAGLLARCRVVVSNDSGPLHLAAAVGAPTVGIYWLSNVITADPLSRATHRVAVAWQTNCPVCGAPLVDISYAQAHCDHRASVVAGVPTDYVAEQALDLFAGAAPHATQL